MYDLLTIQIEAIFHHNKKSLLWIFCFVWLKWFLYISETYCWLAGSLSSLLLYLLAVGLWRCSILSEEVGSSSCILNGGQHLFQNNRLIGSWLCVVICPTVGLYWFYKITKIIIIQCLSVTLLLFLFPLVICQCMISTSPNKTMSIWSSCSTSLSSFPMLTQPCCHHHVHCFVNC